MSWLLNLAYLGIALLASPWIVYRRFVMKKRLGDWRQKFLGDLPQRDLTRPCIWLHAVSVGEVVQLRPVLDQLSARLPGHEFWITTTTATGHEVAKKLYPQHRISYFPFDFTWSVARALDRVRPSVIVLVELELWPNFIAAATQRQIPVLLINGRVSDRSYRSYRRIRPLLRRILPQLHRIAVQNQTYANRLIDMGAAPDQISVTGSIKFDRVEVDRGNARTVEMGLSFGLQPGETLLIAGSTQAPEEELALAAYRELHAEFPRLRLMLVPRHKERFEEVAALVENQGLPLLRRSRRTVCSPALGRQHEEPPEGFEVARFEDLASVGLVPTEPTTGRLPRNVTRLCSPSGLPGRKPRSFAGHSPEPRKDCDVVRQIASSTLDSQTVAAPVRASRDGEPVHITIDCSLSVAGPVGTSPSEAGSLDSATSKPEGGTTNEGVAGVGAYSRSPGLLPPVLLLDTLGELSAAWGLADIAFVGGSLSRRGGQNMIEPAGFGAAVLFGPHTHNFKDVVALLLDAQAARVIPSPEEFTRSIRELLTNPQHAKQMGHKAQALVTTQSGATSQTVDLIVGAIGIPTLASNGLPTNRAA